MSAKEKKNPLKKIMASAGGGLFALFMAAVFVTPLIPMTVGKMSGYYPTLMEMLTKCPDSKAALGDDIKAGFGLNTGSCSGGSGGYSASGRMPVKGSKASGTLRYSISKSGGMTTLHGASLSTGGKDINVASCLIRAGFGSGGKGGTGGPADPPQPKVRAQ